MYLYTLPLEILWLGNYFAEYQEASNQSHVNTFPVNQRAPGISGESDPSLHPHLYKGGKHTAYQDQLSFFSV